MIRLLRAHYLSINKNACINRLVKLFSLYTERMENMKKFNKLGKSLIGAVTVSCMLFAAGMTGVPYYGSSFVAKSKVSKSYKATKKITADEAKRIALSHAGVGSARFKKAKLDYENGVKVYEIEFKVGNLEYEYDINVSNGAIVSSSVEVDD